MWAVSAEWGPGMGRTDSASMAPSGHFMMKTMNQRRQMTMKKMHMVVMTAMYRLLVKSRMTTNALKLLMPHAMMVLLMRLSSVVMRTHRKLLILAVPTASGASLFSWSRKP